MFKTLAFFLLFLLFFLGNIASLSAQEDSTEQKLFRTKDDYYAHQAEVQLAMQNWLQLSPFDVLQKETRQMTAAYAFAWISGAPHVKIVLGSSPEMDVLKEKSYPFQPDLLLAFVFGQTLHLLEFPEQNTHQAESIEAGIKGMLTFYDTILAEKSNKKYRHKVLDRYKKMAHKKTLLAYINSKI
ncbi:hypothetical protein [Hugenholtzia roseola]|uniref:hypothetical protein n=1 Tax=Hugenholtzia roseola TaxID=1002 RepID=UPI001378C3FD|nr:hypothetical protein [Hugenholtzia roseola]